MSTFKKIAAATVCASGLFALAPVQALQITNFETLTKKSIERSYFFDWNRNSSFRAALIKAFKTSNLSIPAWVRQGSGPSSPAKVISRGATHFVLLDTCKPRDCNANSLYVLFDPATKIASAVGKFENKVTWVGKPNPVMKEILTSSSGFR